MNTSQNYSYILQKNDPDETDVAKYELWVEKCFLKKRAPSTAEIVCAWALRGEERSAFAYLVHKIRDHRAKLLVNKRRKETRGLGFDLAIFDTLLARLPERTLVTGEDMRTAQQLRSKAKREVRVTPYKEKDRPYAVRGRVLMFPSDMSGKELIEAAESALRSGDTYIADALHDEVAARRKSGSAPSGPGLSEASA